MAKSITDILIELHNGKYNDILEKLYVDETSVMLQKERYVNALCGFLEIYGEKEVEVYSAPGRSEIGGNHTDHQHGKVLAASVNIDTIAIVAVSGDDTVYMKSEGYPELEVDLEDLNLYEEERGTTSALIRGVAAGVRERGYKTGGFYAYVTSQVLTGSGLSSSAAFEVLIGNIFSGLFNRGRIEPVTIAKIGQQAENEYFGKPCGLMDQMASAVGGLVYIDFANLEEPVVESISVDFDTFGHSLCIVDTKGSHADLTDDYAAIPQEMKKVAAYFGAEVLRQVDEEAFYHELPAIRSYAGDRAVLRSMHWFEENRRVDRQRLQLLAGDFEAFKELILASGNSSYKYLQNVYANHKADDQSIALALLLTEKILGNAGAWRVHGGGFAGTIQAFVPNELVGVYKKEIEQYFGQASCHVLKVRPYGGTKVLS